MKLISVLESNVGNKTNVYYSSERLKTVTKNYPIDAYIVNTVNGFSPLGINIEFIAEDIAVSREEIARLADMNRYNDKVVSLTAIPSKRNDSILKGVILAASEGAESYKKFATPFQDKPYRDFYYNVTYESIAYCVKNWGASNIAISHLSGSNNFHQDVATCNAEALAHFCDLHPNLPIKSFTFLGCCMDIQHFKGIARLNKEGKISSHYKIPTTEKKENDYSIINLEI